MSQASQASAPNPFSAPGPKPAPARPAPPPGPGHASFATFLILCSTSFFLGILFSLFPYDYPILWAPRDGDGGARPPVPAVPAGAPPATAAILAAAAADPFATLERHLTLLHAAPPLISRILHIVVATGLLGFFIKLVRPTESNLLFDGASLALYVVGIVVYLSNIVKGLRAVTERSWDAAPPEEVVKLQGAFVESQGTPVGRKDSLRVMSASNTILALVLVGVLVLQAGQWYAERKEGQEMAEARAAAGDERRTKGGAPTASKKKN